MVPIIVNLPRRVLEFQQFDEAYVARLRKGDSGVEEHFTNYFGQLILIKMRGRLRSRHTIEDVRQETFLRVFRILRSEQGVRHPERLGALVNAVCNNVFLETLRRGRRHEGAAESAEEPPAPSDVLEELISKEEAREVRQVLDELPEKDRRLLRALWLDESSRDDLCAQLQVDRQYLRVLLHRAKESFRARFTQRKSAFRRSAPTGAELGRP